MDARRRTGGELQAGLRKLGLSANEAKVYLALLERGRLSAPALTEMTGVPRGTIYPVLSSLTDRGIIQVGAGYGGRYQAVAPQQAITSLIRWEREALAEREHLAESLAKELEPLATQSTENQTEEPLEVLRDRRAVSERFEELQRGAREEIAAFVKAPILITPLSNPLELDALRRGVKIRGVYEKAVLDADETAPYLRAWVDAGEEARVFDGTLPHKLAVFDARAAVVPMSGSDAGGTCHLVIRDAALATGLLTLFETFWERARPLQLAGSEPKRDKKELLTGTRTKT